MAKSKKIIIMGAAGRDFHNFNIFFKNNPEYRVLAFTATQIPYIEGRKYPPELAGKLYPKGIPIFGEEDLPKLISEYNVDAVVFSYSDVSHNYVMQRAALVNACGASFWLLGAKQTMLRAKKPVIAVCAVRTGCGKSQTTRYVCEILKKMGKKVAVVRHPMPYGDLKKQVVQKFETYYDLNKHKCTIEEREEYEPHIESGNIVFAGVDYGKILKEAENCADVILWDGGNNDHSFYFADLYITVADPHRVGHELSYYAGTTNVMLADVFVINKEDTASKENIDNVEKNLRCANPKAKIIHCESPVNVKNPDLIKGKRVLVIEDGPTLTHGEMKYGAGIVAAKRFGAKEIVDPRRYAVGEIKKTFEKYPLIGALLPAMGYSEKQIKDLEKTINSCDCDSVVVATPIDLGRLLRINKPYTRVTYELREKSGQKLSELVANAIGRCNK
ncbi:MAG: cyclic 2,3-diphosphoglycerate synthase [Candidatus Diapherotrites archaeon]|nr:cyclic 2,3-diphosphoglycerate synthase [Candidatus Diapherotrites archaeon]